MDVDRNTANAAAERGQEFDHFPGVCHDAHSHAPSGKISILGLNRFSKRGGVDIYFKDNVRTHGGLLKGKWCHPRYALIVGLPLVTLCDEPSAELGTNDLCGGIQVALMSSLAQVASHDEVADLKPC